MSYFIYGIAGNELINKQTTLSADYNSSVAKGMDEWFRRRLSELQVAAMSSDITSGNASEQVHYLSEIRNEIPEYETAYFVNANGIVMAHTISAMVGNNYGDREYFQKALTGTANVSGLLTSRATGHRVMVVAVPVYNGNHVVGVLAASVAFNSVTKEFLNGVDVADGDGAVLLTSSQGDVVYYHSNNKLSPPNGLLLSLSSSGTTGDAAVGNASFTSRGQEYVVTHASIPVAGYSLMFVFPKSKLVDSTRQIQYSVLFIVLGATCVVLVTEYFLVRNLSRPIRMIERKVRSVANGDLSVEPIVLRTNDEVGKLARSFNVMAKRLKSSVDNLHILNQVVIDNTTTGILLTDSTGCITHYNAMAGRVLSLEADHLAGLNVIHQEIIGHYIQRVIHDGQTFKDVKLELVNHQGQKHYYLFDAFRVHDEHGNLMGAFAQFRDITERTLLEAQVIRLDKLALVGQLSAGFAHEIRNPLTSVKGFVEVMFNRPDNIAQYKDLVLSEINRINQLVTDFVLVTKPSYPTKKLTNVSELIQEVAMFVVSEATLHNVEVCYEIGAEPLFAVIDKDQIRQVLLNILKNAFEAIESDGRVTIQSEQVGSDVAIRISDNGPGIPESALPQVFNPFFTSKPYGTGLGLSISARIIESHNGSIHFETSSEGTTVLITFPCDTYQEVASGLEEE